MTVKQCDDAGRCYYVNTDAWHIWGRWLLLALLVVMIFASVPFLGYLMSRKRMSKGFPPVPGCAWMFPNPYKNTPAPSDTENMVPRYRAHDELREYQRQQQTMSQQQTPQMRGGQFSEFAPEFEVTDTTDQSFPSEEKVNMPHAPRY